jgi:hypothetical protein
VDVHAAAEIEEVVVEKRRRLRTDHAVTKRTSPTGVLTRSGVKNRDSVAGAVTPVPLSSAGLPTDGDDENLVSPFGTTVLPPPDTPESVGTTRNATRTRKGVVQT